MANKVDGIYVNLHYHVKYIALEFKFPDQDHNLVSVEWLFTEALFRWAWESSIGCEVLSLNGGNCPLYSAEWLVYCFYSLQERQISSLSKEWFVQGKMSRLIVLLVDRNPISEW